LEVKSLLFFRIISIVLVNPLLSCGEEVKAAEEGMEDADADEEESVVEGVAADEELKENKAVCCSCGTSFSVLSLALLLFLVPIAGNVVGCGIEEEVLVGIANPDDNDALLEGKTPPPIFHANLCCDVRLIGETLFPSCNADIAEIVSVGKVLVDVQVAE
jgi:hypothetical protein